MYLGEQMKKCTKCGIEKPLTAEYYYRDSLSSSGFRSWCKVCKNEYNAEYHQNNKEAIAKQQAERTSHPENKKRKAEYDAERHKEAKNNQPACVYQIVNSVNNKIYIGQTMQGVLRWKNHLKALRNGSTGKWNPNLQADFNKFGEDAFKWSIIKEYPKDKKLLESKERQLIKQYEKEGKQLYNIHITENK